MKGLDYDMIQRISDITNTRKEKVLRKTISLKNYVSMYAKKNGYIMSNNKNARYGSLNDYFDRHFLNKHDVEEHDEKYLEAFKIRDNSGAIVGDPLLNVPMGIKDLTGKPAQYILRNVFDMDFRALYPSVIIAYNIDSTTQVGKFFFIDMESENILYGGKFQYDGLHKKSKNQEASEIDEETGEILYDETNSSDLGPILTDSIIAQDWAKIGEKFMSIPNIEEIYELYKERIKIKKEAI